jgi:hypothetical protein
VKIKKAGLILTTLVLVIFVGISEALCRLLFERPGLYPYTPNEVPGMKIAHPKLGWVYAPNFSARLVTTDYETTISTNELGFRDRPVDLTTLPEQVVLAVGSSFTSGIGVESDETWVAVVEQLVNAPGSLASNRFVNAGINAYSLKQIRLAAQEWTPLIEPDLIVAGVSVGGAEMIANPFVFFNGTTVRSDVVHRLKALPDGFLLSPFYKKWAIEVDFWFDENFYFGAHILKAVQRVRELVAQDRDRTLELSRSSALGHQKQLLNELDLLISFAQKSKTPLVILLVNGQQEDGGFGNDDIRNAEIRRYCAKRGVHTVDPLPTFKELAAGEPIFRFLHDGHWTVRAHTVAGGLVADLLIEQELLPSTVRSTGFAKDSISW